MRVKTFYAARVNQGHIVQYENSVAFSEQLSEATLFSSKRLLNDAMHAYAFGDDLVVVPVDVLMLSDAAQRDGVRLFLTLEDGNDRKEVFAVTLPKERADALVCTNSAVSLLRTLFSMQV